MSENLLGELLDCVGQITGEGYEITINRATEPTALSFLVEARKPGEPPMTRAGVTLTEAIRLLRASVERRTGRRSAR